MKTSTNSSQLGFAVHYVLLVMVVIGAIGFIGGTVYTNHQKQQELARKSAAADQQKKAAELKLAEKAKAEEKTVVEVPAPATELKPAPVPAPAPAPTKPAPQPAPAPAKKKEVSSVGITASSLVGADAVVLTAGLPGTYSGTCKALVKHMDGSNHMWLEAGFTSSSSCSISVPRSKLTSTANWQYYLYFNSSDWTVKGDSGKHTFNL